MRSQEWENRYMCGEWDSIRDVVCNAILPLISEIAVLLLRDVNDILVLKYMVKPNLLSPGVFRA